MKQYSRKTKTAVQALCAFVLLLLLAGCTAEQSTETKPLSEADRELLNTPVFDITSADQRIQPKTIYRTVTVDEEGTITIDDEGDYLLNDISAEKIIVDAEEKIVHLVLDGVAFNSSLGPALEVKSAGKVVITLAENSDNYLTDSSHYKVGAEPDSCIYAECDLTFNGTGSLTVVGFHDDAIHSKGKIKLLGGEYYFKAKRSGLRGNKGVFIDADELTFETEKECILTKKTGDDHKGTIQIMGGGFNMVSGRNCISSAHDILISGCRISGKGVPGLTECFGRCLIEEGCVDE